MSTPDHEPITDYAEARRRTIATYDAHPEEFGDFHGPLGQWQAEMDGFCARLPGKRVLDLGCGSGRDAHHLAERGLDYLGIDASAGMVRVAREREPGLRFEVRGFEELGAFADGSFDGVWSFATLLHAPRAQIVGILWEIHRILVPGGALFVSIKERQDVREGLRVQDKFGGIERYFAYYTEAEFSVILRAAGFALAEAHAVQFSHFRWLMFLAHRPR